MYEAQKQREERVEEPGKEKLAQVLCALDCPRFAYEQRKPLVGAQVRNEAHAVQGRGSNLILDGNATAAGMNRLLDGDNVKDTVKK